MKVKSKFIAVAIIIILLMGTATILFIQYFQTYVLTKELQEKGIIVAKNVASNSIDHILIKDYIFLQDMVDNVASNDKHVAYAYILNKDKEVVAHTFEQGFPKSLAEVNVPSPNQEYSIKLINTKQLGRIQDIAVPIFGGNGVVHIGYSEKYLHEVVYKTTKTLFIIVFFVLIFGIFIAYYLAGIITKPLIKLKNGTQEISKGNLDHFVQINTSDEIGYLANSFNKMSKDLKKIIIEVNQAINKIATTADELSAYSEEMKTSSDQITNVSQEIARGTEIQASKMIEISIVMNDMSKSVKQVANRAQKVAESAFETNQMVQEVGQTSEVFATRIEEIKNAVDLSAQVILELNEKSKRITEITQLITAIADQTNLLALNAAIESARAGEHGKGFVVVADEVKKLSYESRKSAEKIANIIKEVLQGTDDAVASMEKGKRKVEESAEFLKNSLEKINKILQSVEEVSIMIKDIALAAKEQSNAIENVTSSIEEISLIAEENASGTQEVSASTEEQNSIMDDLAQKAQELALLSKKLQEIIANFRIS